MLQALVPLAPLHQPHNLAGIAAARSLAPDAVNIACFDTAFHANHSPLFHSFALPGHLRDKGVLEKRPGLVLPITVWVEPT